MIIISNINRIISNKLNTSNYQNAHLAVVVMVVGMIVIAWQYFQLHLDLQPCPMCISQRLFAILAAVFSLIAIFHIAASVVVKFSYSLLSIASIIGGISVAVRQLWLQSLPADQVPACGPAFNYVVDNFPLGEMINALLLGDGNCAEVKWQLLGISITGWSGIAFIILLILAFSSLLALKNTQADL